MFDPQQLIEFAKHHPYFGVAVMIIPSGLGLPIPEDISLLVAGYLCYLTPAEANLWIMIPWALFLVVGSDLLLFYIGRRVGDQIVRVPLLRRVFTAQRLETSRELFEAHGGKILFAARFMPGIRAPLFFTAGHLRVPAFKVILYDGGAALLSVPAIILAAWYFGEHFDYVTSLVRRTEYAIIAIILLITFFYVGSMLHKRLIGWVTQRAHEKVQQREEGKGADKP